MGKIKGVIVILLFAVIGVSAIVGAGYSTWYFGGAEGSEPIGVNVILGEWEEDDGDGAESPETEDMTESEG